MNDAVRDLRDFLANMGIAAEVRRDFASNQPLVVMTTRQFHERRAWIETWFMLIEEAADYSTFHARPRGTGDTK